MHTHWSLSFIQEFTRASAFEILGYQSFMQVRSYQKGYDEKMTQEEEGWKK
jgi:hypothetical protein